MNDTTATIEIREFIWRLIASPDDPVKADARLVEDLGVDDLDLTEISMALDEEYDVELSEDELRRLSTVEQVARFVQDKA